MTSSLARAPAAPFFWLPCTRATASPNPPLRRPLPVPTRAAAARRNLHGCIHTPANLTTTTLPCPVHSPLCPPSQPTPASPVTCPASRPSYQTAPLSPALLLSFSAQPKGQLGWDHPRAQHHAHSARPQLHRPAHTANRV